MDVNMDTSIRRGDVCVADFGKPFGIEPGYRRHVLVVQSSSSFSGTAAIVAIITSATIKMTSPEQVKFSFSDNHPEMTIMLGQLRTIDMRRIVRNVGHLDGEHMAAVDAALIISLGLTANEREEHGE